MARRRDATVVTGASRSRLQAWLAGIAAALTLGAAAFAQEAAVNASVDRAIVRENESFTFTIRAEGLLRAEPEIAPLEQQFDVLQRSSSSRIQIVNGQTAQVTEWQFQLMPKSTGAFTVPAVRVGNLFTNPVELNVVAAEAAAGAPADIFMELEAEPSLAYVQAQVIFTLKLFIGVSTGRATLTAPEVTGGEAIVERLGEDSQYQTARGGRSFIVRERRYAIFPQQPGVLTVGPATFEAMVIPDRGFSRVSRFRSGSLDLTVRPAVPPPASSPNAVWLPARNVTLSESWSNTGAQLAVGIPQTRTVTVQAEGLLETQLPELILDQQGGIRQYADQPVLEREITPEGLRSRRSVSLAVIAQSPGDIELSGIQVPWWNVSEQRWEIAQLPPRVLQVLPSAETAPPVPVEVPTTQAQPSAAPLGSVWPLLTAVLGAAWVLTVLLWVLWARRKPRAGTPREPSSRIDRQGDPARRQRSERHVLRTLRAASAVNDPAAARTALLQWGELKFPAAPPRSLGALAQLLPDVAAREVLDLEAHIYGGAAGPWDGQGLSATLAELETAGPPAGPTKAEPLLPLYR